MLLDPGDISRLLKQTVSLNDTTPDTQHRIKTRRKKTQHQKHCNCYWTGQGCVHNATQHAFTMTEKLTTYLHVS